MATAISHNRPMRRSLSPTHIGIATITLLALWLQLPAFLNHDVAWILYGTRQMIDGATFGRDIIEPNPPLAWYLSMPSTWVAMRLGLPVAAAFQWAVAAAAVTALLAFHRINIRGRGHEPGFALPTLTIALFILVFPNRDFGQREHLLLIAILPYLALVARRCERGAVAPLAAALIGIAAGAGLALKPYFLAVPLLVEASAMLITRRWLFPLRIETITMAAFGLIYALSLFSLDHNYVSEVVPLAQGIYWSFNLPLANVATMVAVPLTVTVAIVALGRRDGDALPLILAAAVAGLALACLAQQKGYSYHRFPVWAGTALAIAAVAAVARDARRRIAYAVLVILLFAGAAHTVLWWQENRADGGRTAEIQRLVAAVDRHAGGDRFLAFAVHPYPGFPTALYTDASWSSRTNSQWFLPAVAQLRRSGDNPMILADAEQHARAFALHDLSQNPALVLVDTDSRRHTRGPADFDFLDFYREDPRFAALWSDYREIQSIGGFRLFVRETRR